MQSDPDSSGAAIMPPIGSAEYTERYKMFDEMALGVMERNSEAIAREAEKTDEEMKNAPLIDVRFDVTTAQNREQNKSVNEIDLRAMVNNAYYASTGKTELPSHCCIIETVKLESATNTLPVDISLKCTQSNLLQGSYQNGKIDGEEHSHQVDPVLYIVHADTQMHLSSGRELCNNSGILEQTTFRRYRQALKKDIEDSATLINGGKAMEYLSPHAKLVDNDVIQGDWLVNIIYQNPTSFQNSVQAIRTPVQRQTTDSDADADTDETFVCSLRMHLDDWRNLNQAVNENVLEPLRKNIIDLEHDYHMQFTLEPTTINNEISDSVQIAGVTKRNSTSAWRQKTVEGHPGRCCMSLQMTIKFV